MRPSASHACDGITLQDCVKRIVVAIARVVGLRRKCRCVREHRQLRRGEFTNVGLEQVIWRCHSSLVRA